MRALISSPDETHLPTSLMASSQHFLGGRNVHSSVIWLDMSLLDFSVFNNQGVALAAVVSED